MRRLVVVAVVSLLCAACIPGVKAGGRCNTTDWGDDGVYALKCEKGHWVRKATKAQVASLLIALAKARQPTPPPTTSTPTTTATPTTTIDEPDPQPPFVPSFWRMYAGGNQTCALTRGSRLWCWGDNSRGQLGVGNTLASDVATPIASMYFPALQGMTFGANHVCALELSQVWCWGANDQGQLGDGTTTDRLAPTLVPGLTTVISISAGGSETCALQDDFKLWCWGANDHGQLGLGIVGGHSSAPAQVPFANNVVAVSTGGAHVCASVANGRTHPWCWGANNRGQVGDGTTTDRSTPTPISEPWISAGHQNGLDIVATGVDHTCIASEPDVYCWGDNTAGEIGTGASSATPATSPAKVTPTAWGQPTALYSLTLGDRFACGFAGGTSPVFCWGANDSGQLGNGDGPNLAAPSPILDENNAPFMQNYSPLIGLAHGCLQVDIPSTTLGYAWDILPACWGDNSYGQLETSY